MKSDEQLYREYCLKIWGFVPKSQPLVNQVVNSYGFLMFVLSERISEFIKVVKCSIINLFRGMI